MKGTSKLSIKANKIIGDFKRTETSIDRFTNKYRGKGCARKITHDDFLGMYKSEDERKFIQKYAETKLAFSDTIITMSAYIFAIMVLAITLLITIPQLFQNGLVILQIIWPNLNKSNLINFILFSGIASSLMWLIILPYVMIKLSRNEDIIMSIEDKWKYQDESYSNTNTKKEGEDGTIMKNGYKTVVILISVVFLVMVVVAVTNWVKNDNWEPIDVILTSAIVGVTAIYAWLTHTIVKQGADRDRIAFIERKLEKLYFPMRDLMKFLDERKVAIHGSDGYGLILENHEIATKKIDEFVPFQYLATNDVQESWPKISELLQGHPMDSVEYEDTIKIIKDKINRDIEVYTKELKSLLKED